MADITIEMSLADYLGQHYNAREAKMLSYIVTLKPDYFGMTPGEWMWATTEAIERIFPHIKGDARATAVRGVNHGLRAVLGIYEVMLSEPELVQWNEFKARYKDLVVE